jgi:hypothetical protein
MLKSVVVRWSRVVEIEMKLLLCYVYKSMTLLSKIWEACFAETGKVVWRPGAVAGPILPAWIDELIVY